MENIICGELIFNKRKYHFTFQNNNLLMLPSKMTNYHASIFWDDDDIEKHVNIEGKTHQNYYICFIQVKPYHIGSGVLRAFVPAYVINKQNCLVPVPNVQKIEKMILKGKCLDNFYLPKRIVEKKFSKVENKLNLEIDLKKHKTKTFKTTVGLLKFYDGYNITYSNDINEFLNVYSILEMEFNKPQGINKILEYYKQIQKFFCFINNRRFVIWDSIILKKKVQINGENRKIETKLELFVAVNPDYKIDLEKRNNIIIFEDIEKYFLNLYKEITKREFNIDYLPINKKENSYISNDKYLKIASAFESEFNKLYPNFKSTINKKYKYTKNIILKDINKQINLIKITVDKGKEKKYFDYFKNIIEKIDGTLEEKIIYSLYKYDSIIKNKKIALFKNYNLTILKNGSIANIFIKRRNQISHGEFTGEFLNQEVIAYILVKICVFCITMERCGFLKEDINKMVDKMF